jgi:hypothetical protein
MNKSKFIKSFWYKLLLIILLPLLIFLWLFSPLNPHNYQFEKNGESMVLNDNCPSFKCSLRQIINIPFRSDYYNFCFVDSGNSSSYPYAVSLSNGETKTEFNITQKEKKYCKIVDLRLGVETFTQRGSMSFNITNDTKKIQIISLIK